MMTKIAKGNCIYYESLFKSTHALKPVYEMIDNFAILKEIQSIEKCPECGTQNRLKNVLHFIPNEKYVWLNTKYIMNP